MRLTKYLLLIALLNLISCQQESQSVEQKLNELLDNNSEISSLQYDSHYLMKYLDYSDTTNHVTNITFIRNDKDSLFGGSIWYQRADSIKNFIKYYNTKNYYIIYNKKKEVIYSPLKTPPHFMFKGNFDGSVIKTYFLKNSDIKKIINDTTYQTFINESKDAINIKVRYPDDGEVVNMIKQIYIDKDSAYVNKISFRAEIDTVFEYREWNLKNVKFNEITQDNLEDKFLTLTKDYTFKPYKKPVYKEPEKVTNINNFKGAFLKNSNKEFNLKDYKGKIIILDFWYRSCPPCEKSIPQLNNIYDKHLSKDVVMFGINDVDVDSIDRSYLPMHIKNNNINYPNVLVNRSESKKYNVLGYPTIYIIDKTGQVIFENIGFDENLEKKVDSVLSKIK